MGDVCDFRTFIGAVIDRAAFTKISGYVEDARRNATIVQGGRASDDHGYFVEPTLVETSDPGCRLLREEIFGPVLCVVRAESMQEAMDITDGHEFGNGACIFTRDGEVARYFSDHIKAGMVGINVALPVPAAYHSFGGWKRPLFGDLSAYGPDRGRGAK